MNTSLTKQFKAARRVSTPLISIKTPDQAVTVATILGALTNGTVPPVLQWDCVRGCQWLNTPGLATCWALALKATAPVPTRADEIDRFRIEFGRTTVNIVNILEMAHKLPEGAVLIVMNAQMAWDKGPVIQAAWNLRDPFKSNQRTLVLLTDIAAVIPPGLRDALPLSEELPSLEDLDALVTEQCDAAGMTNPTPTFRSAAVDAVCGLPAFSAEQAIAMSFVRGADKEITLDLNTLWTRKREMIEQADGLTVYLGKENFTTLGGLDVLKEESLAVLMGRKEYRVIVFIDEIEKAFAGLGDESGGGDSSGTTQELLGLMLTEMQNQDYSGLVIIGPPGTGKTAFAKSLAGETKRLLIILDMSGMKSKYVGASTANLANAFAVIRATSQGRAFFIATCNSIAKLPPELKRRFKQGVFFMDLPTNEEKEPIWQIYLKQFELDPKQKRPNDNGWTGADIKTCCEAAWQKRQTLLQAAQYLTPVAQTDAARIERLRLDSSGKYLSASYPGKYEYMHDAPPPAPAATATKKRSIKVE